MPPPRFPNVLRPCHPSWRAYQVRRFTNGQQPPPTAAPQQPPGDQQPSDRESDQSSEEPRRFKVRYQEIKSPGRQTIAYLNTRMKHSKERNSIDSTPADSAPAQFFHQNPADPRSHDVDATKAEGTTSTTRGRHNGGDTKRVVDGTTMLSDPVARREMAIEEQQTPNRRHNGHRGRSESIDRLQQGTETRPGTERTIHQGETSVLEAKSSHVGKGNGRKPGQVSIQESVHQAVRGASSTSLLEELFPEMNRKQPSPEPGSKRNVPRLHLPDDRFAARQRQPKKRRSLRDRMTEALQSRGEDVTVLTLSRCSTELSESDFRRLIPKGRHIETWIRDGEFTGIIPGRDPISLERQPFYYLLFKSTSAALAYQENAARLHKLAKLHTPGDEFSAIPPPPGLLEDGEDLHAAVHSYTLVPPTLQLRLTMVLQPYQDSFRSLIAQRGYQPIVSASGEKTPKVLLHVEGFEINPALLYRVIHKDGLERGVQWAIAGGPRGLSRLQDLMDMSKINKKMATANADRPETSPGDDAAFFTSDSDDRTSKWLNQQVQRKLYNRWIVEFEIESDARRFARVWHRKVVPHLKKEGWKDMEQERICNAEFLW